jgi:hypothetical protein
MSDENEEEYNGVDADNVYLNLFKISFVLYFI